MSLIYKSCSRCQSLDLEELEIVNGDEPKWLIYCNDCGKVEYFDSVINTLEVGTK